MKLDKVLKNLGTILQKFVNKVKQPLFQNYENNFVMQLNEVRTRNTSKSEERTSKMQFRDCELMGITWLLAKNRSAYIHTVSNVFRAIMMSTPGSNPRSCSLNSDGLPLAVDSSEIDAQSSSPPHLNSPLSVSLIWLCLMLVASLFYLPKIS